MLCIEATNTQGLYLCETVAYLFERKPMEENTQENVAENATEQEDEQQQSNLNDLVAEVKATYEGKLLKQRQSYEERIKEREEVIKQLVEGDATEKTPSLIDKINEQRLKQCKW